MVVFFVLGSLEVIKREGKNNGGRYSLMVLIKMFENVDFYLVLFVYWCVKWYILVEI